MEYDVAIIGGGPSGSTFGSILRKYMPTAKVVILERETFPRDHVGESQLPPVTAVLEEMGCWSKVEAAGFPVKTGALYRWGSTEDLWRFDFLLGQEYEDKPRPGTLEGQRRQTTFHVDRAVFDQILLKHAAELGCEVNEGAKVGQIEVAGDRVAAMKVEGNAPKLAGSGGWVRAKHYVDATGHAGILRRALGVAAIEPTSLKNIAIWQYWRCAEWAELDGVGKGGVRVRVMSVGNGWLWFIPLSCDRTSVGFVTSADHYKQSGLTPTELYAKAVAKEPHIAELLKNGVPDGEIRSTKDWSFVAGRMAGENWMLVGESLGFADPILAAGMALAMVGAKEAAYLHAALLRGDHEGAWLKTWYAETQAKRISQHIKFADYWYSANGHFSELQAYTSHIAAESGLSLNPKEAFQWLGTGGFVSDDLASPVVGSYRLGAVKSAMQVLSGIPATWEINLFNHFTLNLEGATSEQVPYCTEGKIETVKCFRRGTSLLPMTGVYRMVYRALNRASDGAALVKELRTMIAGTKEITEPYNAFLGALDALEGMAAEGWITGTVVEGRPFMNVMLDEATISMAER